MRRLAALGVGVFVSVVLVAGLVAQLVLPGIAAQNLRDRLARSGQVLDVQVDAFPAIELLWHHADKVVVRLGRYRPQPGKLGGALNQTGDVGTLDASAREVDYGLLTLYDATLTKRGDQLRGTATVTEADLRSALPILTSVTPVASADGRLTLRGTASLFGLTASADATVSAENGRLVVVPDVPFGGLATVTLFSDPQVSVQSVSASPAPRGFSVLGTATLH
jgi:hypothetical protein